MKFSALTIFLILLILLVVTVLICRCAQSYTEGMIAYQYNVNPKGTLTIPMYSASKNKLHKVYDSIYFDNKNGNLVEVDANTTYVAAVGDEPDNVIDSDSDINALHIVPRGGGSTSTYVINSTDDTIPTPETTMNNSMTSIDYTTKGANTDTYKVFMMPWHDNTYIHVMDLSGSIPTNTITSAYTYASSAADYPYTGDNASNMGGVTESRVDNDSNNNKMVTEPMYNTTRKVYQLSEYVKYDVKNASLLISAGDNEDKTVTIYNRGGGSVETLSNPNSTGDSTKGDNDSVSLSSFVPRIMHDICGQNMVLYIENAKKTMVALINYDSDEKLDLRNVKRFTEKGVDTAEPDAGGDTDTNTEETDTAREDSYDYYDKIFNGRGSGVDSDALDKYMLKTQIVPPVCPACPSCNYGSGACGKCGGCGGAGTQDKSGESLVKEEPKKEEKPTVKGAVKATGNIAGEAVGAVGDVATGAVGAAGDVATGAVGAAGDVATGAVGAAGNVATGAIGAAGDVATGTVGAVGDVATSAVGAVSDVAGGVLGAVGDVASGAIGAVGNVMGSTVDAAGKVIPNSEKKAGTTNNTMQQQVPQGPIVGNTGATDPYSYYGQLPPKAPSNYIPRTADFSKFAR